ncbi:MFS transporter [Streptomyces sp. NPDC048504]|uniref:MFS transporter n=1 Tax=Streptomyces sp. NPDC048504 TaxID=3365559 RepID=UPI0037164E3A
MAGTIFLVAANLRPAITSFGPVVGLIARHTGLSSAELGVLGALPLLAFAAVSPFVHILSRRVGAERAVLQALLALIAGTALRSWPGSGLHLWIGTALVGVGIAVCNVLVPTFVKREFAHNIALMTGAYTTVMSGSAALGSGLAMPIATAAGWPAALGVWAVPAVVAAAFWATRFRDPAPAAPAAPDSQDLASRPSGAMWTSAVAWQVALFMGAQSTTFYLLVTWLPSIETSVDVPAVAAGWHLFSFQGCGILAGLGVTAFMHRRADLRLIGAGTGLLMATSMFGLLAEPRLALLWVILSGLSSGSALVVALTLVGLRARTAADTGRLSGMAQGAGYLLAATGPSGAGLLFQATGRWTPVVLAVVTVALAQSVIAVFAGRPRFTHPEARHGSVPRPPRASTDATVAARPAAASPQASRVTGPPSKPHRPEAPREGSPATPENA